MKPIIAFGEQVEGYDIPVLNEREIRAAAGLYFVTIFLALMFILFKGDFLLVKYTLTLFLTDLLVRVFINPKFSPSLIIGRLIVQNQVPEYVGAKQKKFAWIIGIVLSSTMFILLVVVNAYSPITGLVCLICLIFLFFETAFGICLGCSVYRMIYQEKAQYCPGEVCERKDRQPIQKTSWTQWLVVLGFVAYITLTAFLFNGQFSKKPHNLFGNARPETAAK